MKLSIKNKEVQSLLGGKEFQYPKYSLQLINLANYVSRATRPSTIGHYLTEVIKDFKGSTLEEWQDWYYRNNPDVVDNATDDICEMLETFKIVIESLSREEVRNWVEDLFITKTYSGLKFQEIILVEIAHQYEVSCRFSTPEEESMGIDGYLGDKPVSVKPMTYKNTNFYENIQYPIIYYEKTKDSIVVEFDLNFN